MSRPAIASLSEIERNKALQGLPLWTFDPQRQALYRRVSLPNFVEAIAAMMRIGFAAEQAGHHPEWTNIYNIFDIWLTTHEAEGVSERDIHLAHEIDALVWNS